MQTLGKYRLNKQVMTEKANAKMKVKKQGQYFTITSFTSFIKDSKSSFVIYGSNSSG